MNNTHWKLIEDIIKKFDLKGRGIDTVVMENIESALEEAYFSGCCDGGMDSELMNQALDFFKEEGD